MRIAIAILGLLTLALALVLIRPEVVYSFKSPVPEPQWVPSRMENMLWRLQQFKDCHTNARDLSAFGTPYRCPELI